MTTSSTGPSTSTRRTLRPLPRPPFRPTLRTKRRLVPLALLLLLDSRVPSLLPFPALAVRCLNVDPVLVALTLLTPTEPLEVAIGCE
jgi:hypothetical protein